MKKMFSLRLPLYIMAIIMAISLIVTMFSGCSSKNSKVKNLLSEFEYSCNKVDLNAILICLNPSIANPIKASLGIVEMFTNVDTEEILNQIGTALTGNSETGSNAFFESIKIVPDKISVSGKEASVTAKLTYKVGDQIMNKNSTFKCIEVDGKWYIASFNIF